MIDSNSSEASFQRALDTVSVNGALLRSDRLAASLTQEALHALCAIRFSIGTLRRAERGERIGRRFLTSIAEALDNPTERYIANQTEKERWPQSRWDLSGHWTFLFVQDDLGEAPYLVEEQGLLDQKGQDITGSFDASYRNFSVTDRLYQAKVIDDMLLAECRIDGWPLPFGLSSIQLKVQRGGDWLDGFTTWYDLDSQRIECSRHIGIRHGSTCEESYLQQARRFMAEELTIFSSRIDQRP